MVTNEERASMSHDQAAGTSGPITNESGAASTRSAEGFESTFVRSDREIAALASQTKSLAANARILQASSTLGDVKALSKALQSARAAAEEIVDSLERLNDMLLVDFPARLRDGAFFDEVIRQAERDGLKGVRSVHGLLLSYPVTVAVNADDLSLRIGKKRLSSIRPSALVSELTKQRRRKPPSTSVQVKLLSAIERAYSSAANGAIGLSIPIKRIYDELVPLPGQSQDYSELDFVIDLYALQRSRNLISSSGRVLSFPASTSSTGKTVIRIATEDGEERLFSHLRFDDAL
jgi:hypothetical protein